MLRSHQRTGSPSVAAGPSSPVALTFRFPELFPRHACLLVDASTNTAILLCFEGGSQVGSHPCFRLTSSATRVLLALLSAYPASCSYRTLCQTLFPLSRGHARQPRWEKKRDLRPVRRVLATLQPFLHHLGMQVISLRGQGYLLIAHRRSLRKEQSR